MYLLLMIKTSQLYEDFFLQVNLLKQFDLNEEKVFNKLTYQMNKIGLRLFQFRTPKIRSKLAAL